MALCRLALVEVSHCGGFSCCAAQAGGMGASVVVTYGSAAAAPRLWRDVVAQGLRCSTARGIFPQPGIKLVSLAPQGRFSTPGPPGSPPLWPCCLAYGILVSLTRIGPAPLALETQSEPLYPQRNPTCLFFS